MGRPKKHVDESLCVPEDAIDLLEKERLELIDLLVDGFHGFSRVTSHDLERIHDFLIKL